MPTIDSYLRVRRLSWLRKVLQTPSEHRALLAALLGKPTWYKHDILDKHGRPTTLASPWLQQWWQDLE
eukprot:8990141-Heterocapsa_arctica.AAC.1